MRKFSIIAAAVLAIASGLEPVLAQARAPVPVPDGGVTLLLLGGALVGIETLRRRLRK